MQWAHQNNGRGMEGKEVCAKKQTSVEKGLVGESGYVPVLVKTGKDVNYSLPIFNTPLSKA